jgi:uncharacterized OsmC-like protein
MNYPKRLEYTVSTRWDGETGGTAEIDGHTLNFDTPTEYQGNGSAPCPDQLFLASVCGCLMDTFINLKNRLGAETRDIEIEASTEIELTGREGYRMTGIQADIKAYSDPDNAEINRRCAEFARDYCHITKSIEQALPVNVNIQIIVEPDTPQG